MLRALPVALRLLCTLGAICSVFGDLVVLSEDFDPTINASLWVQATGAVGADCGADSGSAFFFKGPIGSLRILESVSLDLTVEPNASVSFSFRLGTTSSQGTCEKPEANEHVDVEYSVDSSHSTWVLLHRFAINGPYQASNMSSFSVFLPSVALTNSTRLRWQQSSFSGANFDAWGIDSIVVTAFQPTPGPTAMPTASPTHTPTALPTVTPTAFPTHSPTADPTAAPTTSSPTAVPTAMPTAMPTDMPSLQPTVAPTAVPTSLPTVQPTASPSVAPTLQPSAHPSRAPSIAPTGLPTAVPTLLPVPSLTPTLEPTPAPTDAPTPSPTTPSPTPSPTVVLAVDVQGLPQASRPNPENALVLSAALSQDGGAPLGDAGRTLSFLWESIGGFDLSGVEVTQPDLLVPAGGLSFDTTYRFRLTVTPAAGDAVVRNVTFKTASKPAASIASCSASPLSGVALQTEFELFCLGWTDIPEALPLAYGYSVRVTQRDGSTRLRRVVVFSSQTNATFVAPYAASGSVTIVASVRNAFGVVSSTTFQLAVSTPDFGGQGAAGFASQIVDGRMASAADNGDVSQVTQYIVGLDELLNAFPESNKHSKTTASARGEQLMSTATSSSVREGMLNAVVRVDTNNANPDADANFTLIEAVASVTSQAQQLSRLTRVPAVQFVSQKMSAAAVATTEELSRAGEPNAFVEAALPTFRNVINATVEALAATQTTSDASQAQADADSLADTYMEFVEASFKVQLQQTSLGVQTRAATDDDDIVVVTGKRTAAQLSNESLAQDLALLSGSANVSALVPSSLLNDVPSSVVVGYVFAVSKLDVVSHRSRQSVSLPADVVGQFNGANSAADASSPLATLSFFNTQATDSNTRSTPLAIRDLPSARPVVLSIPHGPPATSSGVPRAFFDYSVSPPRLNVSTPGGSSVVDVAQGSAARFRVAFCRFYNETTAQWEYEGCRVNAALSSDTRTTCQCTHLTSFSVEFRDLQPGVTSIEEDDVDNVTIENILKHPATFLSCTMAVLLYVLLLPWARRKDREYHEKYSYLRRAVTLHSLSSGSLDPDAGAMEKSRDAGLRSMDRHLAPVKPLPKTARREMPSAPPAVEMVTPTPPPAPTEPTISPEQRLEAQRVLELTAKARRDAKLVAAKEAYAEDKIARLERLYFGHQSKDSLAVVDDEDTEDDEVARIQHEEAQASRLAGGFSSDDRSEPDEAKEDEQQSKEQSGPASPKVQLKHGISVSHDLARVSDEIDDIHQRVTALGLPVNRRKRRPLAGRRNLLRVGTRVVIQRSVNRRTLLSAGSIEFYGNLHFAKGKWVGIRLDDPDGMNDGKIKGIRYFQCEPQHGLFVKPGAIYSEKEMASVTPQINNARRHLSELKARRLRLQREMDGLHSAADDIVSTDPPASETGVSVVESEFSSSPFLKGPLPMSSSQSELVAADDASALSNSPEEPVRSVDSNIQETDPQQTTRDTSTNGDGDGATDGATGSTEEPDDEELDRLYEISMKQSQLSTIPKQLPIFQRTSTWRHGRSNLTVTFLETFRHKHLWLSVALRHPRDRVSSVERMSCILALALGIMAFNAAFYANTDSVAADIVLAVLASVLTMPVTILMVAGFRGGSFDSRVPSKHEYATKQYRSPGVCPRWGKRATWAAWFCWCVGAFTCALIYGIRFEVKGADEQTASGVFVDLVGTSITNRWLLSCLFAYVQDIIVNRPLYILLRSYVVGVLCVKQCQ